MNRTDKNSSLYTWTLLLLLLLQLQGSLWAQEEALSLPVDPGESIVLSCDRSMYGVNERIHYSAIVQEPGASEGFKWSRILLVELLKWDGSKELTSNVIIENNRAEGVIIVPGNLVSGVYYLRAYTKWLRNYGPGTFAYIPLRILNPYSKEVLAPPSSNDSLQYMGPVDNNILDGVAFSGLKEAYGTRELVELEIQLPAEDQDVSYSLSIAKTESLSSLDNGINELISTENEYTTLSFLPEIQGLSLSGMIVDSETGKPVEDSRLQLSSYSNPFLFSEVSSSADGSFLFTLPHFGDNPEFHLAETGITRQDHRILLDPQFCNKAVRLPFIPLLLDSAEQETARELLVNVQLNEHYGTVPVPGNQQVSTSAAFYGSESSVINVGDYIELKDLRECINEIIPLVSIRSSNNGAYISILGQSCLDIYPPLVLIDNVPVPNNEELLNIPSSRIKSVEVLNKAYMVGEFRYSGILNISSRQKDMAGISLEGEHYFFNYQLIDSKSDQPEARSVSESPVVTDIRNQLYWNPEIKVSEEGISRLSFSTSDAPGQYLLTLRRVAPGEDASACRKVVFTVK